MTDDLKLFEGNRIRHIYDEEKETYYFSVIDIIAILIEKDYQSARKYWKVLKGRLANEGFDELVTNCYQLKENELSRISCEFNWIEILTSW